MHTAANVLYAEDRGILDLQGQRAFLRGLRGFVWGQNSAAGGFPRALGASQAEPLDVRALSAKMRTRPPFASMWVRISKFRVLRKMPAQSFVQTAPSIFPTEKGNEWQACVQGLSLHRARCLLTEHCNDTLVCSRRSATLTRHPALPAAHDGEHRNMQRLLRQQCVGCLYSLHYSTA